MPDANKKKFTLTLESTDAAIIFKRDGSCEVSWPQDTEGKSMPENFITSAAVIYALQNSHLCDLIYQNFECVIQKGNQKP